MALRDPVAAYTAATNLESTLICQMLADAGIEAHVVEDVSQVGVWMFGLLPQLHKPQVWIERSDLDRAKPLLEEFASRAPARQADMDADDLVEVEVLCEECEKRSYFPASRRGFVETCEHCGAYVDVGEVDDLEGWDEADSSENDPA